LRGCNVGITDWRDFIMTPLRWVQVPWYKFQVSWRLVQTFKEGDTQTHRQQGDFISLLLFFQNKENRLISNCFTSVFIMQKTMWRNIYLCWKISSVASVRHFMDMSAIFTFRKFVPQKLFHKYTTSRYVIPLYVKFISCVERWRNWGESQLGKT
jgi:hypothetical protein